MLATHALEAGLSMEYPDLPGKQIDVASDLDGAGGYGADLNVLVCAFSSYRFPLRHLAQLLWG